ncbi:MAG: hypothetical protein WBD16_04250 [Pyrinomonadaceae bacterium]
MARVPHTLNTNGTAATWAGSLTEYDLLGRVKRTSVPTEIDSSWNPAGDDYTRGPAEPTEPVDPPLSETDCDFLVRVFSDLIKKSMKKIGQTADLSMT